MVNNIISWIILGVCQFTWWYGYADLGYTSEGVFSSVYLVFTLVTAVMLRDVAVASDGGPLDGTISAVKAVIPKLPAILVAVLIGAALYSLKYGFEGVDWIRAFATVVYAGLGTALLVGAAKSVRT